MSAWTCYSSFGAVLEHGGAGHGHELPWQLLPHPNAYPETRSLGSAYWSFFAAKQPSPLRSSRIGKVRDLQGIPFRVCRSKPFAKMGCWEGSDSIHSYRLEVDQARSLL
jgi:hypothetical protein